MTMILGEKTVREIIYILGIACILAFVVNYLSPSGIALKGSWNTEDGVITANSKMDVVVHDIEIQTIAQAKKIFDSGTTLFVDARHTDRFNEGHIKGAVSLSVYDFDSVIDVFASGYSTDQKIATYCSGRECEESHQLAVWLKAEGYENVKVFIDGYPLWEDKGYPIERK